jgi:uncharacterized damage-inducible protein DinB
MASSPPREIALLLAGLEEAFDRRSWHGPNLLGSLRGLSPQAAAWRPAPGRHNIWELVVHAAYWKYAVTRRMTGATRGSFPVEGSNWFPRPIARTAADLRADLRLLKRCHADLLAAVRALPATRLRERMGSRDTVESMIRGVAAHDLYHAGQVQLLKRLQGRTRGG